MSVGLYDYVLCNKMIDRIQIQIQIEKLYSINYNDYSYIGTERERKIRDKIKREVGEEVVNV